MSAPEALKTIFERIESTVIAVGHQKQRTKPMPAALRDSAAHAVAAHADADYFRIMVHVIFYSGMKSAIVNQRMPAIDRHFASYAEVAAYGEPRISAVVKDEDMLSHEGKVRACVDNAREFARIVGEHGSFGAYLGSIASVEDLRTGQKSVEDLQKLWTDLQVRFKFLGRITSFHYLMEIGYRLVKPDRVITRIFSRLRLVDELPNPDHPNPQKLTDDQLWQIVRVGQQIAQSVQLPIRYVDLVLVVFGQEEGGDPDDLSQGVCLDEKPRCGLCEVRTFCQYEPKGPIPALGGNVLLQGSAL